MDKRESNHLPSGWIADVNTMTIMDEYEDEEYDAKYVVCPCCDGAGKYVNPSIDSHGITSEEFAEDPEFAESYFSGNYDVRCETCNGLRVVMVPESEDGLKAYEDACRWESDYHAECAAERRMGC